MFRAEINDIDKFRVMGAADGHRCELEPIQDKIKYILSNKNVKEYTIDPFSDKINTNIPVSIYVRDGYIEIDNYDGYGNDKTNIDINIDFIYGCVIIDRFGNRFNITNCSEVDAISYSEYICENVSKSIDYTEYLAEQLNITISYTEYIAENIDKNISYTNYIRGLSE